jgi:uncharacterized membrane protein YfcA
MGQPLLCLVFGSLIGFTLGLLGGGGSILTVPILVYLIGQDVHAATGTSLAIVGTGALLGAIAHAHKGNVRLKCGMAFGTISMVAAQPGVWLNRLVAGRLLLLLFGCLMLVVGIRMVRRKGPGRPPDGAGGRLGPYAPAEWARLLGLGGVVGLLTGFFGIGGGFLIVPALVLVGRFPIHHAVGTSLLVIAMTSASGLLGHLRFGTVDLGIVKVFVLGGAAGILSGTAIAGLMPERALARAFGWFIILLALYVVYRNAAFQA